MSLLSQITKGVELRPLHNVIYGADKVGKSSFACEFPNPITLSSDGGTSYLDTSRFVPSSFEQALQFMAELYNSQHDYQTLNIDTGAWLEDLAIDSVLADHKNARSLSDISYGAWKKPLTDKMDIVLDWIAALNSKGMHVNTVCHAVTKNFKNPEGPDYDRFSPEMYVAETAERFKQKADNILYCNFDTIVEEKKEGRATTKQAKDTKRRILHTQRTAAYDAGTRIGLPARIDLSDGPKAGFDEFWSHYATWAADPKPKK